MDTPIIYFSEAKNQYAVELTPTGSSKPRRIYLTQEDANIAFASYQKLLKSSAALLDDKLLIPLAQQILEYLEYQKTDRWMKPLLQSIEDKATQ